MLLPSPPPARDLRHVVAVLADVLLVLDQPLAQLLREVCRPRRQSRHAGDHVHDQVETIQIVQDHHVKWGRGCTFFLVATHM